MRVISGTVKGRRLFAPKGQQVRPTADRVKESLFNILADKVVDARVLDVYAGTGALAIEALSRGAASALLIDNDRLSVEAINRNLVSTTFSEQATVIQRLALTALKQLRQEKQSFDLIFLDPPYRIKEAELEVVVGEAGYLLDQQGLIVLEHRPGIAKLQLASEMSLVDIRRYGETRLSFFKKRENCC